MSIDLSDLNDAYVVANGGRLPNGVYPAQLIKAEVQYSKAGNRQVVWDLNVKIPSTGRTVSTKKFSPLNLEQMYWLRSDLNKMGTTLGHINELHEALRRLSGVMIEIEVQTGTDYYNVDFGRLISRPVT
jgi:hypothetical protein